MAKHDGGSGCKSASGTALTVLTLNTWGLWLIAKKRAERMRHLATYLQSCTEDVVLLQEVWVDDDAQLLIRAARGAGLIHATHFRSGIFGAGLVTLSRHPILRHAFWRYAAGGYACAIACGDYYAAKGVGWVRLDTPLGAVDVFNTHLHANYCHDYRVPPQALRRAAAGAVEALEMGYSGRDASEAAAQAMTERGRAPDWMGSKLPDDDDAGTRIAQLLELSELIDIISSSSSSSSVGGPDGSSGSSYVILGGDLNCKPDTLEVDLLRMRLPHLADAWTAAAQRSTCDDARAGNDDSSGSRLLAAAPNPEGFTCHAPGSSFKSYRQVPERIDYIWTNLGTQRAEVTLQTCPPTPPAATGGSRRLSSITARLSISGSKPAPAMSYSDHFAVRAVLVPPPPGGAAAAAAAVAAAALSSGDAKSAAVLDASPPKQPSSNSSTKGSLARLSPAKLLHRLSQNRGGDATQTQQPPGQGCVAPPGGWPHRVATAYGAMSLLEEGYSGACSNGRLMLCCGGFLLATLAYFVIVGPLLWPSSAWAGGSLTAAGLAVATVTALAIGLLLMGGVGDAAQRRALQSAMRLMRVWMHAQGLAAMPCHLQMMQEQR